MKKQWFIGIDISKKTLDVALYNENGKQEKDHLKISNDQGGYKKLLVWIHQKQIDTPYLVVCMEHTGSYGLGIAHYLEHQQIDYSMVCPLHLKRSLGIRRGKDDKTDAFAIARFCFLHRDELNYTKQKSEPLLLLQGLMLERKRYIKEQATYKAYLNEKSKENKTSTYYRTQESLVRAQKYIKEIEKEILEIINTDKELTRSYELLLSITGVGFVNAVGTILHTNNFQAFASARAYGCYIGVVPFEHSSGTSIRGKARTSKLCAKTLKAELSQAALSAIAHDPELRTYYKRKIKEGKHPGVAKNAVKFKIIQRMFAVIKRGTPFVIMGNFAA